MTMPAEQRTPAIRVAQAYAGATNTGTGVKEAYLIAEILATGTMSDGQISEPIKTQAEARTLAGAQSFAAYLITKMINEEFGGSEVPLILAAVAEPAGVTAAQTFTYAGVADSLNTHSINIGGETYSWNVPATTTADAAGTLLAAAVNLAAVNGDHPWAAVNVAGVVTVTCKQKGTLGNTITTSVITIGTEGTQTLTAGAATMAAGTLEPTLTTVLGNLAAVETEYLATTAVDTTSIESIRAHLATKGAPPEQLKCMGFWGGRKTVAAINTDADTIDGNGDAVRMWCGDCYNTDTFPPVIAAQAAVVHAHEPDCARPHNGLPLTDVKAPAKADRFTTPECETLLANGVTPLRTKTNNSTKVLIVRSVVIRTNLQDPMDFTKQQTMDEFRQRIIAVADTIDRAKLKKDGEQIYTSGCVSAESVGSLFKSVYRYMERKDQLQGLESGKLDDRFSNVYGGVGRTEHVIPNDVVDGFHDCAVEQVLQLNL